MDYKDYLIEDFLSDPFFVSWVQKPDAASDHFWIKWLEKHPEKMGEVMEAKAVISSAQYKYEYQPTEKEYLSTLEKIHQRQHSRLNSLTADSPISHIWKYAAVIAILIAASSLAYFSYFALDKQNLQIESTASNTSDTVLRKVPKGQKLTLTLPDGSEVKINSQSKFWFSKGFAKEGRTVYLEGEAFFEVKKDTLNPFRVISKDVTTHVLGTAFNVCAYPEQEEVKVVVEHGKVRANNNVNDDMLPILMRGDMATFKEGADPITSKVDLNKELAWKDNVFFLEKATFQEAATALEKWYGTTCIVPENLKVKGRLSCEIDDPSLKDVLEGLGFSSNVEYELKNDTVWFYPKTQPMK